MGPGRVGRLRPLIELVDRQPPVPQRPLEPPDDGLPFDVGRSMFAWHRRVIPSPDAFKSRASHSASVLQTWA